MNFANAVQISDIKTTLYRQKGERELCTKHAMKVKSAGSATHGNRRLGASVFVLFPSSPS